MNYYNEIDPKAAQWLRNLILAHHIPEGVVDTRSIEDVTPNDLRGFTQCHFFAGIGVWAYALGRAGWPTNREVWTGSCPCQPFSAAGQGAGLADERHLWPAWHYLIQQCRPRTIFGEQVSSGAGLAWLDVVQTDLEDEDYAVGAFDLCAAGVGAPHIRQRLYFVGDSGRTGAWWHDRAILGTQAEVARRLRCEPYSVVPPGAAGHMADANGWHAGAEGLQRGGQHGQLPAHGGAVRGYWSDADWIECSDGKARPVEPGTFPLAHGLAGRVGRLRAYGNAIVAPLAQEFITAYMKETA